MPQWTGLNPWEFSRGQPTMWSLSVPNSINLALVSQFIQTLQSSRLDEPVFLLASFLPKSHDITWLNLKYHVTWSSTIYGTPFVQLHPQPMCLVQHSEISLLCSKKVSPAIRWPPDECQLLYSQRALLWCQQHCPQAPWQGPEQPMPKAQYPLLRKVMPGALNDASQLKKLLTWILLFKRLGICPKRQGSSLLTRGNGTSFPDSVGGLLRIHSGASVLFS